MYYQVTGDMVGGGTTVINTTITGLKGVQLPETLSTGSLKFNGTSWLLDDKDILEGTVSITGTSTASVNRHHVCSGIASNYTLTLPSVSGNGGKFVSISMSPELTKLVTISGNSGQLIDGSNTRIMWANESCILRANDDESGWTKIGGKSIPMQAVITRTPGNQILTPASFTRLELDAAVNPSVTPFGMQDTANRRIVIVRPGKYDLLGYCMINTTSSANGLSALSVNISGITNENFKNVSYIQGTNISINTQTFNSLVAGDYLDLYLWISGSFTTSTTYPNSFLPKLTVTEILTW